MKQLLYSLIMLVFLACSKSSEEEPDYIKLDTPLYPYFCDTETDIVVGTVKKGNEYQIKLYPCCNGVNSEYIKDVTYYLNDIEIEVTNKGAFSANYIIKEEPGIYKLTCKPVFSSEYIIWNAKENNIVVEKNQEPPKPEIIPVAGVAIRLSDHSDAFPFLRKNILLGNRLIIEPVVYPADATNLNVSLSNSNPEIASIEEVNSEKNIITNKIGFTEIKATTEEGNYTAICELSVCDIDTYTKLRLVVGTEGNSITGFYSYVLARFDLNTVTTIPLQIQELQIKNNKDEVLLTENNIEFRYGQDNYKSAKLITSHGLQTYPATGWKAECKYTWNNKEYKISIIN